MTGNSSSNGSSTNEDHSWLTPQGIVCSPHWYMSMSVEILVILINGWISVSFMHHVFAKKLLSKKRREEDPVIDRTVIAFTLAALFLPFFRYVGTIFLLVVGLYPEEKSGCEVANDVSVVGFALAIFPTYAYIWTRQRAFYRHPLLKDMTGTISQLFSKFILLFILLSACASVGLGIYPTEYEHGPGGCVLIGNEEQDDYRTYIYAIVMISSQIFLLGLFLHPIFLLTLHQRSLRKRQETTETTRPLTPGVSTSALRIASIGGFSSADVFNISQHVNGCPSEETPSRSDGEIKEIKLMPLGGKMNPNIKIDLIRNTSSFPKLESKYKRCRADMELFKTVKRVFFLSLVPIISDLSTTLINHFGIPDDVPQTYSFVLFDINVLIHVFTVAFSYNEWREILASSCISTD